MCYLLEDHIHTLDIEERKQNHLDDVEAEAGINMHSIGDPYALYTCLGLPPNDYADPYSQAASQAHVPLV